MSSATVKQNRLGSATVNRILYVSFVLLGLFRSFTEGASEGLALLGIALAFDPFNHDRKWADRPLYQKAWLLLHVGVVFVLLGMTFYRNW